MWSDQSIGPIGRPNFSWIKGGKVLTRDEFGRALRLNGEIVDSAIVSTSFETNKQLGLDPLTGDPIWAHPPEYRLDAETRQLYKITEGGRQKIETGKSLLDAKMCGRSLFLLDTDGDLWLGPTRLASGVDRIIGVEGSCWYLTYESGGCVYSISQFSRTPRKRE